MATLHGKSIFPVMTSPRTRAKKRPPTISVSTSSRASKRSTKRHINTPQSASSSKKMRSRTPQSAKRSQTPRVSRTKARHSKKKSNISKTPKLKASHSSKASQRSNASKSKSNNTISKTGSKTGSKTPQPKSKSNNAKSKTKPRPKTKAKTGSKTPQPKSARSHTPIPKRRRKKKSNPMLSKPKTARRPRSQHLDTKQPTKPRKSTPNIALAAKDKKKEQKQKQYLSTNKSSLNKQRSKSTDIKQLKQKKNSNRTTKINGKSIFPTAPSINTSKPETAKLSNQSRSLKGKSMRDVSSKPKSSTVRTPNRSKVTSVASKDNRPHLHESTTTPRKKPPKQAAPRAPHASYKKQNTKRKNTQHKKAHSLSLKKPKSKIKIKRQSVEIIPYSAASPVSPHPTIGEFYSKRTRKRNLLQRELPSKPENVDINFILLGKIYQNTIQISLDSKLTQILPKLSAMLVSNQEILSVIQGQLHKKKKMFSNVNHAEESTYDLIINNPIFIYKHAPYQGSETFKTIGFMEDFILEENQYIAILSCTGQKVKNLSTEPKKNGHFRSRTHDISLPKHTPKMGPKLSMPQSPYSTSSFSGFGSLTNIAMALNRSGSEDSLELFGEKEKVDDSRYRDLKRCVQNLGYRVPGVSDMADLIYFVHESIQNKINYQEEEEESILNISELSLPPSPSDKRNKKRKRGRSRSWAGMDMKILVEEHSGIKIDAFESNNKACDNNKLNNPKTNHHRYNNSVPDMSIDTKMLRLDLAQMRSNTVDFTDTVSPSKSESRFSRLFKSPFKKKQSVNCISPQTPVMINESSSDFMDVEAALDDQKTIKTIKRGDGEHKNAKHRPYTIRDKQAPMKTIARSNGSTITITRRSSAGKNNNKIKASLIVEGYLNSSISSNAMSNAKWEKLYFTFDNNRLLCWYHNKNSDLSEPLDKLQLNRGECSFNINTQGIGTTSKQIITITIKESNKSIIRHFQGTTSSLEKWKRAFLF